MSDILKDLSKLTPKQRALFELMLKEKRRPRQSIARRQDTGPAPASFSQQRLWLLDQLEESSSFAYNVHITVLFSGPLDVGVLERAINEVVHRHEALRTVFAVVEGAPVQLVRPAEPVTIPIDDLTALSGAEQDAEVERRTGEESQKLFDLSRGPLLRGKVLRLAEHKHVVLVTMHHMVTDRWSLGVLVRELMALYEAYALGQPSPLPELPIQYADYAVWQREQFQGEAQQRELAYWKKQLTPLPPPLELPTDRPRPPLKSYRGARAFVKLPASLTRALKAMSQQEEATLYMLLLSAFQSVLHRYTGQTDLAVGSPIANRKLPELELLIGFFVNTLVMRTELSGNPTFRTLLQRVRKTCMEAYAHQDVPFEKLVEALQPERHLSRNPLFQVMFSFQNTPRQDLAVRGLSSQYLLVEPGSSKFDLLLELREEMEDEITGWFEYDTDLFETASIHRLREHFLHVLERVAVSMEDRLSELPLMGSQERQQVLEGWSGAREECPPQARIHTLIEEQVERTPDAVALTFEGRGLTYRELDARANQLAWHLRSLGVGPEVRVGLCAERSLEMVVGLLGTLKAGGAYVPLDPGYPLERLTWMLEDARPAVLLAQEHLLPKLPAHEARVVCLDSDWARVAEQPVERPPALATEGNLAYVIFTSGSTGRPKGAMNEHHPVCNRLLWMQQEYQLGAGDTVLQKTPFSFDVSVWEFFWPLMVGARLVLARPGGHQEPAYLVDLIAREGITTLHFVPSMLQAFLEEPRLERCASLRRVMCSGEALPVDLEERCLQRLPWAGLHNLYGPTEAAVDVTYHACERGHGRRSVPIGRPVANTQMRVLDANLQPVPMGVAGELYIGGVQVGRGYLRRPELTAERFIPDPFSQTPGARLYRTGDLGRWLSNGELEYIGRADFQVKVRGFRIELGEIEAVLEQDASVQQAVVVAREDVPGNKRLVAYVMGRSGQKVDVRALREHAQGKLPEYMVPPVIMVLEALPLSPNGKVDRKALPAPSFERAERRYVAPSTPTQQVLANIWAEVLRVEKVGTEDDFFALGGHSLLATQVVSRVRSALGVELPLRALFEAPTVAGLARRLPATGRTQAPPLVSVSREGALPLSFSQQRLWFLDQLEPASATYNIPSAFLVSGQLDVEALRRAIETLVARHESLRTTFHAGEEQPLQRIHAPSSWTLPVVELRSLAEPERQAEARRLSEQEAQRGFSLEHGPLLRTTLLKLAEQEHLLLVTMHHIVSDGWSMGVLVREVASLYEAFSSGRTPQLPALPVQYADYASWQRQWLRDEALQSQLSYWRQQLSGAPPALELPTDRPRPSVQSYRGAQLPIQLPRPLSDSLLALCQRESTTPFMVLLASFQLLLSRYSGQDDICVGTPIAGRDRSELEGLIGFFVNTLVLRSRLQPAASFRSLLAQVRSSTLAAYEHQHLPFEKLVEELLPARDLSRSPLFQALFTLQNAPLDALRLPGLSFQPLPADSATSKFDLSLFLSESPEGFSGVFEYNTDLFDASTLQRMAGHFQVLLESVLANPDAPLSSATILSPSERHQLLVEWNATNADFPADTCLHHLFEAQVRRTPEATAVISEQGRLTYRELDARSNQLARRLRSMGVGPESRIGLCVERNPDMLVALLAILKAGGAYVPLDPSYPKERLAWLLEDAQGPALLAHSHLLSALPAHSIPTVCLDSDADTLARESTQPLSDSPLPGNLAYLIYTSGSTGRPKGVSISHRNAVAFLHWALSVFQPEELRGVLASTSLNFDLSVFELFAPLACGGGVVLARNALHLAELSTASEVTLLNTVPSAMEQLLRMGALPPSVCTVNLAGEALPQTLASRVYQVPSIRRLYNLYGPSEDTTYSTFTLVRPGEAPPIGRPISNSQAYVLDAHLHPVPVGVLGELYLAGEGLARGYLHRPELTAERFLPNPFGPFGSRMYRTGDRVRLRPDGVLEYFGRVDFQVKVRGFRIELGEVESALRSHPSVRDCVLLAREDVPGDKRLVAYVVGRDSQPLSPAPLRDFLRQRLPEYMVPSAFVVLPALPLTSNGKVDRKALPPPEASALSQRTFLAPRTDTERALADIWAQLLRVEKVGLEDDFFALGGHSLLATQAISRVRSALGVELPLRVLFEASTLSALSARVDSARRQSSAPALPPLSQSSRQGELPLSFSQQRLWFLDQLEPGTATYNLPSAFLVSGQVDVEALRRAIETLVARHESLRTTFHAGEEQPLQRIHAPSSWTLPVVELRSLAEPERQAEARRLSEQEAQRGFSLEHGPLLRTTLLKLAEQEHLLLVTMHHIVSDGWSMGVLVREVASLYEAFSSGRTPQLPALPVQYADYASWQRQWLRDEALQSQLSYWRQQLSGAPPALELPTDRPRPSVQSYRGAQLPIQLPRPLSDSLLALCQRESTTPFMVLLASFQLLLSRYSGQDDICVGTPIAGRDRSELEGLIGFFVNTLVLRSRLQPAASFRSLLAQVRSSTLAAYEHQHLPFEKLVEELLPARDLSRSPLFQALFTLQNAPLESLSLPGLSFQPLPADSATSKFDLSLSLIESPEGFSGIFEYNTDLFDASTLRRMAGHFQVLLESVLANPDAPLASASLLSPSERHQLLVEWNASDAEFPADTCAHHLFEAVAARTPQAEALCFEGTSLTYRELEARANQLAWHLRSLGVGPEVPVGLCVERSPDMVVAMLAVLKAGGAYLPLEPSLPQERLAFMLADCRPAVLLTHQHLLPVLPSHPAHVVCLDSQPDALSHHPERTPPPLATAGNLAYVIYTSGSTGRPKGTLLAHRGLCNTALAAVRAHGFHPHSRVLQYAAFGFDASVAEVFATLLAGACLVLAPRERLMPGEPLRALLREQRVSAVTLTPSVQAQQPTEGLEGLHTLISAGEATSPELVRRWAPGRTYLNAYGPTEVTVCATITPASVSPERVTLGKPWPNTRLYVLDEALQPVPAGIPGELYIGGVGLARGYLGRPELTAERFLPNPFGPEGSRLYRTGDRVRWLSHGELEYLGRADFQVKLRGFRIELGEVESALLLHPSVSEACVIAREDVPGDKRLVAYLVARESTPSELREFLRQRLPEYMVPSAFVVLPALPLTSNGKVDRKALPAPDTSALSQRAFLPPVTETERALAGIWAQLLRVEKVGLSDDFFALGGHSLLATQVVSRVRSALGVELPLRALFEASTLSALRARVDSARSQSSALAQPPLRQASRLGELPLSFSQQRLWFLDQLEPGTATYNVPSAFRISGQLDVEALRRAIDALVARHESLRTTFHSGQHGPVQRIASSVSIALPVVELMGLPQSEREAQVHQLSAQEATRSFNLEHGPLLRTTLLKLAEQEHLLLVTLHHIVSDGWSMGVLVREVASLYEAFSSGRTPQLPALPVQYADYASWQRQWLRDEALQSQLSYWRQQLSGAPPALELPTDRPRPSVQSYRGAQLPIQLPRPLSDSLLALCQRESTTPFMVLLASFQLLLSRYSGQDDICVGTPIAGRDRSELEGLIGFFVNTLVLRSRLQPAASFRSLLAQVRSSTLAAYEHQHLPFEKLVEELLPARDLSRSPLFQALFTLQNAPLDALRLPGLSFQPLPADSATSKFDLSLFLSESPEGFSGVFEYNTDLFDASTLQRMAGHFQVLLESVLSNPDAPLSSAAILSPSERHQLLVEWNATNADFPADTCLHHLFEAQVRRTPEATAVISEQGRLTYRELDARSNQLARRLRSMGVGPESRIGLCVERNPDMLVALLAILKAGGAYVPLDPSYPKERLAWLLEDAQGPALLAHSHLLSALPPHSIPTVCLDSDADTLARESTQPLSDSPLPGNLAYLIYTSGSTGRPKGVSISHRNAVAFLHWALSVFQPEELRGVLASTSLNFDLSVFELFAPLACGGGVVLARNALHLAELSTASEVTLLNTVPSAMEQLLRMGALPPSVCTVNLAGEALPQTLASRVYQVPSIRRLYNLYGPSEDTTYSTFTLVRPGEAPPIGRPISNSQAYVLDAHLHPVPVGVLGELYLAGEGLARGYLHRPELTAERFLPNPFGPSGSRMYRTGDRVRLRPDGVLEYFGRVDFQVKVRGFRIELGEVESALRSHPSVRDCVLLAREDVPGDKRLVAYVTGRDTQAPSPSLLRAFLKERLPEYMVPSAFVVLPALPLTSNGKVDRKALPPPEASTETHGFISPRDALELELARIFEELLGVHPVGARGDFFALGGHSLLAVRLQALVQERTGHALPLASLFQAPTVEQLATLLRRGEPGPWSPLVPIQPRGSRRPFFCVHPVGGNVLCYAELARQLGPDRPFYGLQSQGLVSASPPPLERIEEMAALYVEAVRTVQPEGPYLLGGWSLGGVVAFEMARQLEQRGERVEVLALIDPSPATVSAAPAPEDTGAQVASLFAMDLGQLGRLELPAELLAQGDSEALLGHLLEEGRKAGLLVPEVGLEQLRALRDVFTHNLRALHQYVPRPIASGLTVLRASESPDGDSPERGWGALTRSGARVVEVPGDHYALLRAPHVQVLAEKLAGLLARADALLGSTLPGAREEQG
jgi:amino acid adenylation domain-containing protein